MGLDSVEIVMEVEESFCISIRDEDAERARTPRHLVDLVVAQTQDRPVEPSAESRASRRPANVIRGRVPREVVELEVRRIVADVLRIPLDRVTVDAQLARDLGAD